MKIFTIGYEGNSAKEFFTPLLDSKVKKVIDVRLKPFGSGFANKKNLPFLLSAIGDIEYHHMPECAPTLELFDGLKSGNITWPEFKKSYKKLIKERNIASLFTKKSLSNVAFLCYEADSDRCHRRILAEYLKKEFDIDKLRISDS
jgi:uncharacterized protein YeaO (DUF488 family)